MQLAGSPGRLRVGTSGWSYPNWRGPFYPAGLPSRDWLGHYAGRFDSLEVNTTFYRPPSAATLARWAEAVPPGFRFALKAPKLVTHERRLAGAEAELDAFLDRVALLGDRAGPVLFQLPPRFPADATLLDRFLARLLPGRPYAVEGRDRSWWDGEIAAVLERHGVAFCLFDLAGLRPPRRVTAGFVYLRLHGHAARYRGRYPADVIEDWAAWLGDRLGEGLDVYAYLDNTMEEDHAVRDAVALRAALARDRSDQDLVPRP